MMLSSIGRIDAGHTWVESTAEDSRQTGFLEAFTISPLPGIFEVCLVLRLIVSRIEIATTTSQTGIHDGQVLIGQCQVDNQFGLVVVEQRLQLLHVIGIHLCRLDVHRVAFLVDGVHNLVALHLAAACNHKLRKHVSVLGNFERCHRCDASGANH